MTSREQRKHMELVTPYNNDFYHHLQQYRGPEEINFQHQKMQQIFKRNLTLFGIQNMQKKKVKYQPSPRIKLQLGDGWYCYITDNQLKRQHTIIAVPGAKGEDRYWAGLQTEMNGKCRWVNINIPGFDQQDQRRGTYAGTADQVGQMIVRIILKLNLGKVIYCGHSMGSFFGSYFIDKYPEYVEGFINVTGIVNKWYPVMLGFAYKDFVCQKFHQPEFINTLFNMTDQERKIQHLKFSNSTNQFHFDQVPFPQMTLTEYFAHLKIYVSVEDGVSQNYRKNMDHKLLRVLFFGRNDPFHLEERIDQSCYYFCFDSHSYTNSKEFKKILKLAERQLKQKMKLIYGIEDFKVEEIQQYFAYNFPDTGHNAHTKRPIEMSKVIKAYVDCLSILSKYQPLIHSKI